MVVNKEIDASGLACPLPILRAKRALSDMKSGQVLKVLATDPNSVHDFQSFARQTGNELLDQQNEPYASTGGEIAERFIHWLRRR